MITRILAHAGETHADTAEAVSHAIPWYIALPLFFIAVAAIGYLTWIISKKKTSVVLLVEAIVLLIAGFTLFNVSAAISVIAITAGIILAGFIAITGLINDSK